MTAVKAASQAKIDLHFPLVLPSLSALGILALSMNLIYRHTGTTHKITFMSCEYTISQKAGSIDRSINQKTVARSDQTRKNKTINITNALSDLLSIEWPIKAH